MNCNMGKDTISNILSIIYSPDSSMKVLKERCKGKVKTRTRSGHWSNSFPLDDFFS